MIAVDRRRWTGQPALLAAIASAWALAIAASATGLGHALHHDELIEQGPPLGVAVAVFLLTWQVHIAAMMLPSSLPLIDLFDRVAGSLRGFRTARGAFLFGYVLVWTGFGALAFAGDVVVHRVVDRWAWLAGRPWLIGGTALLVAGAFQFSGLKDRCLRECRHPGAFLVRHYRRGVDGALALGLRHGLFCVGCCWALMLVLVAAGVANLLWMIPMTVLMLFEKAGETGRRLTAPVGFALLGLGALVLAHPPWMPSTIFGG